MTATGEAQTVNNYTPPCPTCGGPLHDDDSCWLGRGEFYCSEACCKAATGGY